jgi:hypothetical protein
MKAGVRTKTCCPPRTSSEGSYLHDVRHPHLMGYRNVRVLPHFPLTGLFLCGRIGGCGGAKEDEGRLVCGFLDDLGLKEVGEAAGGRVQVGVHGGAHVQKNGGEFLEPGRER